MAIISNSHRFQASPSPPTAHKSRVHDDSGREVQNDEILVERSGFNIRLADSQGRRSSVSMLIGRRYSWRGYQGAEIPLAQPNQLTLMATKDTHLFGTLTIGWDSPGADLLVDQLYRIELAAIRGEHGKVCECIKLAVDPESGSKESLASLFHLAFIFGCRIHGCENMVAEVNPRHVAFYRRMLGFKQAGPERICERVGAVAVLLLLPRAHLAEHIALYGGHRGVGQRSLYPYFFSSREEDGLCARIQRLPDSNPNGERAIVSTDVPRTVI